MSHFISFLYFYFMGFVVPRQGCHPMAFHWTCRSLRKGSPKLSCHGDGSKNRYQTDKFVSGQWFHTISTLIPHCSHLSSFIILVVYFWQSHCAGTIFILFVGNRRSTSNAPPPNTPMNSWWFAIKPGCFSRLETSLAVLADQRWQIYFAFIQQKLHQMMLSGLAARGICKVSFSIVSRCWWTTTGWQQSSDQLIFSCRKTPDPAPSTFFTILSTLFEPALKLLAALCCEAKGWLQRAMSWAKQLGSAV